MVLHRGCRSARLEREPWPESFHGGAHGPECSLSRRQPWQLDGKDASPAGDVVRRDLAVVRPDALAGDCQPEAQTASILASLLEDLKQVIRAAREAAAFVLDRDEGMVRVGVRLHEDMTPGTRELEGVLQQVRNCGREDLSVNLDRDPQRDGGDRELQAPSLRLDRCLDFHLFDELGEQDRFPPLAPGLEAHFGERAVDEVAQARQVATEQCPVLPPTPTLPPLRTSKASREVWSRCVP